MAAAATVARTAPSLLHLSYQKLNDIPRCLCWLSTSSDHFETENTSLTNAQRCGKRSETLEVAKARCIAQSWCGAVTEESALRCGGQLRHFELNRLGRRRASLQGWAARRAPARRWRLASHEQARGGVCITVAIATGTREGLPGVRVHPPRPLGFCLDQRVALHDRHGYEVLRQGGTSQPSGLNGHALREAFGVMLQRRAEQKRQRRWSITSDSRRRSSSSSSSSSSSHSSHSSSHNSSRSGSRKAVAQSWAKQVQAQRKSSTVSALPQWLRKARKVWDDACRLPRIVPRLGECAVVGSSDALRAEPAGGQIDTHDTIWRVNNAPTTGFEWMVGNRTDVRILNHVTVDVWTGHQRAKGEARSQSRAEYDTGMCTQDEACFMLVTDESELGRMRMHVQRNEAHSILPLPDDTFARAQACVGGKLPSTGLVAVQLALRVCAHPVHLYGFYPHCCYEPGWAAPAWAGMNYKYFHSSRSQWVCCAKGREDMENELQLYRKLEAHGHVRLHLNLPSPSPPTRPPLLPASPNSNGTH